MSHRKEIGEIIKLVEGWPAEDRAELARLLVPAESNTAPVGRRSGPIPPPRDTYSKAVGIGRGAGEPPDDEEVERIMHEHRMKKYGGA